jgi:hypothetical protein
MKVPPIFFDMRSAFEQYSLTGDEKFIEHYTLEQLKQVASFLDDDMPYAKAILARIDELTAAKSHKRTNREKWIDRIVSFIFGIVASIAFLLITKWITGSW